MDTSVPDFGDLPTNAQSTPKRARLELRCPICSKVYVSHFDYRKHIAAHDPNPSSSTLAPAIEASSSFLNNSTQENTMDASDVNVSLSLLANLNNTIDDNNNQNTPFKKPAAPEPKKGQQKAKSKPKLICTYCLRGYICSRSFKSHMRTHAIQDAASRFPDKSKVYLYIREISMRARRTVSNAPSSGEYGNIFSNFVASLIRSSSNEEWKTFSKSLGEKLLEKGLSKKIMLPSALLNCVFEELERLLSNSELCFDILSIMKIPDHISQDTQSQFLLKSSLHFAKDLISFILKTFRDTYPKIVQRQPTVLDHEDRQVIYCVGGSVMRGYFRIAYRHKKSVKWAAIASALQSRALCDKPCDDQDASWAKAVDRGGLLCIKPECQKFLIPLTRIVYACEKRDGSVDYEEVLKKVCNCDVSVLWDNMIFDSLKEETSASLMNDVVRCFSRTCVRGFAKRRLNFLKEKPTVSMPLRHAVAKRKTN